MVSGVVIVPTIFATLANIIIGKLIALYISPEDFGIYSLEFIIYSLLNSIFIIPLINAFKTYKKDFWENSGLNYFDNLFYLFFILSSICLLILGYLGLSSLSQTSSFLICLYLLLQSLFNIRMAVFNLNSEFLKLAKFTILSSSLQFIILILFVVILGYSNNHALWTSSSIFSLLTLLSVYLYLLPSKLNIIKYLSDNAKFNKKIIIFCLPLILVAFLATVNNYADRYIIEYFMNTYEVGIYSASYGLGSKISLLMAPILIYLSPFVYENINTNNKKVNSIINKVVGLHMIIGIICCIILYLLKNYIGIFFLSKKYEESFIIIPYIAFAFVILNSIFAIETKFYASGKTNLILIHNFIGAVFNIFLNFTLIPKYGLLGSAYASILSFGVQFIVAYYLMVYVCGHSYQYK
jgi:O-antigen/teichoic acid export membrane protein